MEPGCRALAPAVLTARNEASTPGAVLADVAIRHVTEQGVWALKSKTPSTRRGSTTSAPIASSGLSPKDAGATQFQRIVETQPLNIKQTFIIMNMNFIQTSAVALVAMALVSCQETDTEAPTACTGLGATNSVTAEEIEAEAGDHIDLEDIFCDNEALSEVRWDIHNGEGHAHEDEEEGEGGARARLGAAQRHRLGRA